MAEQEKETLDQQPPLEEPAMEQTEAETAAETPEMRPPPASWSSCGRRTRPWRNGTCG